MIVMECKECGQKLDESYAAPEKKCPCGSLLRRLIPSVEFNAKVHLYAKYRWWNRTPKGRASRWGMAGDDFYQSLGKWSILVRTFDGLRDWYYEHIVDKETGRVIKHCEEKLSDHRGHGSAKKTPRKP
jgi:hypothetical protein